MKILVKQKKWTLLGKKYIVSIEGTKKYIIERIPFSILPEYDIKDHETWKIIGSIKNKIKLRADAKISIEGQTYLFK